jgi:hypothetical protein
MAETNALQLKKLIWAYSCLVGISVTKERIIRYCQVHLECSLTTLETVLSEMLQEGSLDRDYTVKNPYLN